MHSNFKTRSFCTRVPFCTFSFLALFSQTVLKIPYILRLSIGRTSSTRKGSLVQSQYRPPYSPTVTENSSLSTTCSYCTSFKLSRRCGLKIHFFFNQINIVVILFAVCSRCIFCALQSEYHKILMGRRRSCEKRLGLGGARNPFDGFTNQWVITHLSKSRFIAARPTLFTVQIKGNNNV